jgi:hypothetical protein
LLKLVQPFLGGAFRKVAKDALAGMEKTLAEMASEASAQRPAVTPSSPVRSSGA